MATDDYGIELHTLISQLPARAGCVQQYLRLGTKLHNSGMRVDRDMVYRRNQLDAIVHLLG